MFIPQITFHRITSKLEKAIKIHHLNPQITYILAALKHKNNQKK